MRRHGIGMGRVMRRALQFLLLAAPLLGDLSPALARAAHSEGAAIERVDDIRRMLLDLDRAIDEGLPRQTAQWFNFPNWGNWPNWNNWPNWRNYWPNW